MKESIKIIKLVVFLVTVFTCYSLFSDWQNFKAGLMGKPPVEKHISE